MHQKLCKAFYMSHFIDHSTPKIRFKLLKNLDLRDFSAVQWLRLHAPDAGGAGSIPGWETKIPHAAWRSQTNKQTKAKQEKNS